jgi:uncharacterized membrane protein YkoI
MSRQMVSLFAVAFTVAAFLMINASALADEKVNVKDLPKAVLEAIEKRLPGAELLSAKKEKDDGRLQYEVKVRHKGQKYEVEVTPEGKILEVEREDD